MLYFSTFLSSLGLLAVLGSTTAETLNPSLDSPLGDDELVQPQKESISNQFKLDSLQQQLQNLEKRSNAEFYMIHQELKGVRPVKKCAIDYKDENGTEILSLTGNLKSQHKWKLGTIRCYWSLKMNTTSTNLRLYIEENNLGPDSRLTISGFTDEGEIEEVIVDSTSTNIYDFGNEIVNVQIALTFQNSFPGASNPFFKLAFVPLGELTHTSEIVTTDSIVTSTFNDGYEGEGRYKNNMRGFMTIYPEDRRRIKLTLAFMDIEDCRNDDKGDFFKVFLAQDYGTHIEYNQQGHAEDNYKYCGQVGKTSEVIGSSTSAVVFFRSDESVTAAGFSIHHEPE